jgi:predicted N-acyltransferase
MEMVVEQESNDYVIRVLTSPAEVEAAPWNALLAGQTDASPFMKHEYLLALHESGSATPATGWTPRFITLWQRTKPATRDETLVAACALYLKDHSYGEYVFDMAWANAYQQHGLDYYPKAVAAVPFTPVPGTRLMASDATARAALMRALLVWCREQKLSSLHLLFLQDQDARACTDAGLMLRHTVQFHWTNQPSGYKNFDDFLNALNQEKRKKIRQERRKVADAGVSFRWSLGTDISPEDWDFFYLCYERTYLEHGNAPYLSRDFFKRMEHTMSAHWLLFVAERDGQAIATSLIAVSADLTGAGGLNDSQHEPKVAYGRYWGALERVDCLHFEACYYQPLQWCIEQGYQRFEGGAQGEHKMARALLPIKTSSAHWLAHPAFADAVERFLVREGAGINDYFETLADRSPLKQAI